MDCASPLYRYRSPADPALIEHFSQTARLSLRLAELIVNRGIAAEELSHFLNPHFETGLHDPFLLIDMHKAVDRINRAMKDCEKIMVLGDYDADGVPATVILNDYFAKIGYANVCLYIPHRHTEGFGISDEAIEEAKEKGVKLIITVDCGIADVEEVAKANVYGIDVVITDHHQPPEILPPAHAIVDHKRKDCEYPFKELCGSGVAFKLVQALLSLDRRGAHEGWEKWLLDMVGIATIADMVPLVGENRVLARYGLLVARKGRRFGLSALARKAGIDVSMLSEDDVGFSLAPRINAASRMSDPREALEVLLAPDQATADARARELEKLNDRRKGIVGVITRQARKAVHERYGEHVPPVLALGNPEWMPSLLGLVASSLARDFSRPTFLWGREGGEDLKGSCRSDGRADVVAIMRAASTNVLSQCGGHAHAGGFVVDTNGVHRFEEELIDAHGRVSHTFPIALEPEWIDMNLTLGEIHQTIDEISQLAPFGRGNPKPRFIWKNVAVTASKPFGKAKDHLEISVWDNSGKATAIAFFAPSQWSDIARQGESIDIVGTIERGFRGRGARIRIEALGPRDTLLQ